jgi:acetyltransferase-like isoleucine patch superfamily enzyme
VTLRTIFARLVAEGRARAAGLSSGVELGRGVRFGRRVTCSAVPGSRIEFGDRVEIGEGTSITTTAPDAQIVIGDDVFISGGCTIAAAKRIEIGRSSMIAELVSIRDHDHDPSFPPRDGHTLCQPVSIGERVWLGAKATVVRGGSVGSDSVVGAHGLVNRTIPSDCLAVGVPARVKRQLR